MSSSPAGQAVHRSLRTMDGNVQLFTVLPQPGCLRLQLL
jgi:hypothetical protein